MPSPRRVSGWGERWSLPWVMNTKARQMMTSKQQSVNSDIGHGEMYPELDIRSKQISAAIGYSA